MPLTIGSNIASLKAQRRLAESTHELNSVFERLSSGQRINRASDDAAGIAIADSLRSGRQVFTQGIRNFNDGTSVLSIADGAIDQLTQIVTRIRELATQAANGSFSLQQRAALDDEAQSLSAEYTRITKTTEFNGLKIFDGSVSTLTFQGGYGNAGTVSGLVSGLMGSGTFSNSGTFSFNGSGPGNETSIALGDFNGDGILDMATTGNSVVVMLGNGDGTFQPAVTYTNPTVATDLLAKDVNNDGILDLVSSGTAQLFVRLGVGDGTFGGINSFSATSASESDVAAGDFNGDGYVDIVTKGGVLLGNGNGSFRASYSYSTGGISSENVEAGDFNGDGLLDVVFSDYSNGKIGVVLGNGNGTFGDAVTYSGNTSYSKGLKLGDINGDGRLDLVSAGYNGSLVSGEIAILLGCGNGTFGPAITIQTPANRFSSDVALFDMNGDTILDMFVASISSSGGGSITFIGNGNGTFRSPTSLSPVNVSTRRAAVGDLNGDGVLDVVTVGSGSTSGMVYTSGVRSGMAALIPFSLTSIADARATISLMDQKTLQLSNQRSVIGATQSRLMSGLRTLGTTADNYAAAESRIRDVDVAEQAGELTRHQVITRAASAVLAQANQQPAVVLSLLGG